MSLTLFLKQVADIVYGGLPKQLWLEATVVAVRPSASGYTLELADAGDRPTAATLRVFLSTISLAIIRRDLDLPVDPMLLIGMTTCLLIAPGFSARWHLGARVEGLTRAAVASLRQRLLQQVVATLKRDGLWERQKRVAAPPDVTTVVVIHPAAAAGWADIAGELQRWQKAGLVRVRSLATPFEGERAAAALVAVLGQAVRPVDGHDPDVVLIVRGGGAKASLALLDEESVARAICRCATPVVIGVGHAIDRSLADQVAWRAVDTPSKAVALLGDIIRGAARRTMADCDAVHHAVSTMLDAHERELERQRQLVRDGSDRAVVAASHHLLTLWSTVRVGITTAAERSRCWQADLHRRLADVRLHAPLAVEAQHRQMLQALRTGLGRAATLLARFDDGTSKMLQVHARASALLERQVEALQRCEDALQRDVQRRLDEASASLVHLGAEIEAGDLGALMARGMAVVTDASGRLIPTRAAAVDCAALQIIFADGVLAVVPAET